MVTTSKTSTISLRGNRSGSQAENVYLSTRVTRLGPDGDYQYTVDILQHRRSSEGGFVAPVLVGVRDSGNPNKITWNDNAPDIIKKPWNNDKIITNVKDQVRSMEGDFVQNSKNVEDYRRENGIRSFGTDTFPEAASSQPVQNTINPNRNPTKPPRAPLVYPLTLATDDQDYIKFSILERKPNKIKAGTTQGRGFASQRVIGGAGGAVVYLPIPGGLSESTSVSYKESSLNALQLEGSKAISNFVQGKGKGTGLAGKIGEMQGAFNANENTLKELIGAGAAAAALQLNTNELLARQDGSILNPNMELLFNSPQLRSFGFSFKLSPRSSTEGKRILEIIRYFKQAMVPKKTQESFFLKSPNTFKVEYVHKGKGNHPGLNKYKECALVQCQVNYTPEGTYNTFIDGVMHSYEMTLQFRELDPIFDTDYDALDDQAMGHSGSFASFREDASENAALQNNFGASGIGY
jgi:hypothetical protein